MFASAIGAAASESDVRAWEKMMAGAQGREDEIQTVDDQPTHEPVEIDWLAITRSFSE